jgi:hypothetical protein
VAVFNLGIAHWDAIHIEHIKQLDPLNVDAGTFFSRRTFADLARQQGVKPMKDATILAGGLPEDFDVDAMLDEIYRHRA